MPPRGEAREAGFVNLDDRKQFFRVALAQYGKAVCLLGVWKPRAPRRSRAPGASVRPEPPGTFALAKLSDFREACRG